MSAPPAFTALRPERTLSAPTEPLVPLPALMVTVPPPGDTGSQEKRSTVAIDRPPAKAIAPPGPASGVTWHGAVMDLAFAG